jgi:hypothetical protein
LELVLQHVRPTDSLEQAKPPITTLVPYGISTG